MNIIINGNPISLPTDVTNLDALATFRSIPRQGSAIALNGKLIKANKWPVTTLADGDSLLVIAAAYGG